MDYTLNEMKGLVAFLALLTLLFFSVSSVSASTYHGPRIKLKNGTSTNWSGYAALTNLTNPQNLAVSDVKGTWTVPTVSCAGVSGNTYSSAWVGIDGYSSNSVEQLGTEHDCSNGQAVYSAWYEMYPKPAYRVNLPVQAGDVMTGEVRYIGNGQFTLSLQNTTTKKSFSTTQRSNKAQRQSAEWIVEAPWSGGVLPLANFGTLSFTNSYANILSSGLVPIGSLAYEKIDMANADGTVKAITSALTNGTDFSVTWNHN